MAKGALITLTTAGINTGPFNLLTDVDSYVTPFETNVLKVDLVNGYTTYNVPDAATIIRIKSVNSICTNYVDVNYPPTPTTTTTTTSTTTTTTTLPPGIYAFSMKFSAIGGTEACAETATATYYSNSATLNLFSGLTTDPEFTTAAPAGYYCLAAGCPNSTGQRWIRVSGIGAIIGSAFC